MDDFVPVDRDIVNHWIYKDAEYFKVWFEMLHRARYAVDPKVDIEKGQVYTINQGEFMFGRPSWSERLGISEQRLKTLMKKLIDHNMISLTITYRYFSIYKLTNYEKYRKSNQQNNQQKHLEPQGFETLTNQQTNLLSTSCYPAANLLSTTKEERSNTEEKKKDSLKDISAQIKDLRSSYSESMVIVLDEYLKFIAETRSSKKIADSVVLKILEYFDDYPQVIVEYAMKTHMHMVDKKSAKENYTFGILRGMKGKETEASAKVMMFDRVKEAAPAKQSWEAFGEELKAKGLMR